MTDPTMSPAEFGALAERRYAVLTSFRRSGAPVATTVWLIGQGGRIYVSTPAYTGKVKRLRHNPRVLLAPSDAKGTPLGPAVEGTARFLDPAAGRPFDRALLGRYGWQKRLLDLYMTLRRKEQVVLEISST